MDPSTVDNAPTNQSHNTMSTVSQPVATETAAAAVNAATTTTTGTPFHELHERAPVGKMRLPDAQPARWTDYLPRITALHWARNYGRGGDTTQKLLGDLSAGIVVAVMLIPQGMAYSQLAGLPPVYGLYASIFSLLIYPFFSTAPQLAVGPVAMVSLLSNAAVSELGIVPETDRFVQVSIILAFMTGVIQVILGFLKAGFLVNFLSHPVLKGFTVAAAFIIGSSQLGKLLGFKLVRSKYVFVIWYDALANLDKTHILTLVLAIENILLFVILIKGKSFILKRLADTPANSTKRTLVRSIPNALIVVIVNIVLVVAFKLEEKGVAIVGDIPVGIQSPSNIFSYAGVWDDVQRLAVSAVIISLVGFMESISIAKAMAMKYTSPEPLDSNQELFGIGFANMVAPFFGGFSVTGGFSRTSVNGDAGARTPLSSLISALLLLLTVLFLTSLFERLPSVTLGATIVVAVAKLFDWRAAVHVWKLSRQDFVVYMAALLFTLGLGIEEGILIACGLGLALVLRETTKPHWARLQRVAGTTMYRNVRRFDSLQDVLGVTIVRFDAQLYFANTNGFKDLVVSVAKAMARAEQPAGLVAPGAAGAAGVGDLEAGLGAADHGDSDGDGDGANTTTQQHILLLDMATVPSIDYTGLHMLETLQHEVHKVSPAVLVILANMRGPARDAVRRMMDLAVAHAAKDGHGDASPPFDERFFSLSVHEALNVLRSDGVIPAEPDAADAVAEGDGGEVAVEAGAGAGAGVGAGTGAGAEAEALEAAGGAESTPVVAIDVEQEATPTHEQSTG